MRRAGGDAQVVGLWLAEMGYKQAAPPAWPGLEKQTSGIKAVGGGLAAWASMPAARSAGSPSKGYMKAAGGCCTAVLVTPCWQRRRATACQAAAGTGCTSAPLCRRQLAGS